MPSNRHPPVVVLVPPALPGRSACRPLFSQAFGRDRVLRGRPGPAGTVARIDQNGPEVEPFAPEEYARVEAAAHLVGKSLRTFVRDAALKAADDPFYKTLGKIRDRVPQLAEVFAAQDTQAADTIDAWPDPAPMGSGDLREIQQHGHAACAIPHAQELLQIA
ncbi:hypothetical protein [Streptomyces sp. NPDC006335]|uniref:hypothetical protein n=1 Tax=Streptomyces sp. NPDC006335 TaxID=3156895 RepID=UPI0033B3FD6C